MRDYMPFWGPWRHQWGDRMGRVSALHHGGNKCPLLPIPTQHWPLRVIHGQYKWALWTVQQAILILNKIWRSRDNFFKFFNVLLEREREKIPSRIHTQHGAQHEAQSHDPGIVTWAEIKSGMLNPQTHRGTLVWGQFKDPTQALQLKHRVNRGPSGALVCEQFGSQLCHLFAA